jgi:prevent-host-death family protein
MHVWQLQEAKAKLTQLINEAKLEEQIISRHGINEAIVMSVERYAELCGTKEDLVSFFRQSPLYGIDLKLDRDESMIREVDL